MTQAAVTTLAYYGVVSEKFVLGPVCMGYGWLLKVEKYVNS